MRLNIDDRFIQGTAAFTIHEGDKATMSYVNKLKVPLPLGATYEINGQKWIVIDVRRSDYNKNVVNVDLELLRA